MRDPKRPIPMKDCQFGFDGYIYNLSDYSHFEVCLRAGRRPKTIYDYQIRGFYRNPDPDTLPYEVIGNPNRTYTKERCHKSIDNILGGIFDLDPTHNHSIVA